MSSLVIAVASCATLSACRLELAADAGTFQPSVGEVSTLLEQDRVRVALQRADLLAQRYRGPEAELVHGWALWRNGDVRGAATHFRRAAEVGSSEGYAGLAAVSASGGEWDAAVEMAQTALATGDRIGSANAVLASAAWMTGDAAVAARHLADWADAEAGSARGRAAGAMAAAVARIEGPAGRWQGDATLASLQSTEDGGWAVQVLIDGQPVLMKLDLTFRQSLISADLAGRLGIPIDGVAAQVGRSASARWPALLSARQARLGAVDFGGLSVEDVVVAVADPPAGVDGVLSADILCSARWSLTPSRAVLALAPPSLGSEPLRGVDEGRAVAWLGARVVREGVGAQMLVFPRVQGRLVAAGIDIGAASRLDLPGFVVPPGESAASAPLMLGGWRGEVAWRAASLTGWAVDGGVAPTALLGDNVLSAWALHWYPASMQLRVDVPPAAVAPGSPR